MVQIIEKMLKKNEIPNLAAHALRNEDKAVLLSSFATNADYRRYDATNCTYRVERYIDRIKKCQ